MKKQPAPPTVTELWQQANELNAVFPRQLCELTLDEAETAFHRATGRNRPELGLRTEYFSNSKSLEITIPTPKIHLLLYAHGVVQCTNPVGRITWQVAINAPALTDYLRSVGVDYPAKS